MNHGNNLIYLEENDRRKMPNKNTLQRFTHACTAAAPLNKRGEGSFSSFPTANQNPIYEPRV